MAQTRIIIWQLGSIRYWTSVRHKSQFFKSLTWGERYSRAPTSLCTCSISDSMEDTSQTFLSTFNHFAEFNCTMAMISYVNMACLCICYRESDSVHCKTAYSPSTIWHLSSNQFKLYRNIVIRVIFTPVISNETKTKEKWPLHVKQHVRSTLKKAWCEGRKGS